MRKPIALLVSLLFIQIILGGVPTFAYQEKPDPQKEYAEVTAAAKEKDNTKKYEGLSAFVTKYPESTYAKYAKEQLCLTRYLLTFEYRSAGKYDDEFKVGAEFLKEVPEIKKTLPDLPILLTLGNDAGFFALGGKFQFLETGTQYASQAIDLIAAGKKLEDPKINWDTEKPKYLNQMYRTIGIAHSKAKKSDDAITALNKAIEADCSDPYTYYFLALVYQERYEDAARKFNAINPKTSPEATDALNAAKAQAEKVAEFFAKTIVVGQASKDAANFEKLVAACKSNMETPYKISHDNKADGMNEYIESLKATTCKK